MRPTPGTYSMLLERGALKENKKADEDGVVRPYDGNFSWMWKYKLIEIADPSQAPPDTAPSNDGTPAYGNDGPRFGMLFNNACQWALKHHEAGMEDIKMYFRQLLMEEHECRAIFDARASEGPSQSDDPDTRYEEPPRDETPSEPDEAPEYEPVEYDEQQAAASQSKLIEGTPFPEPSPQMGRKGFVDYCKRYDIRHTPTLDEIEASVNRKEEFSWAGAARYYAKTQSEPAP